MRRAAYSAYPGFGDKFTSQSQLRDPDHVVLYGLDSRLGSIDSMVVVRLNELNVSVLLFNECLDRVRAILHVS